MKSAKEKSGSSLPLFDMSYYAFFLRQYIKPATPRTNSAHVDGSGTAFGSTANAASFMEVGKSIVQHIIDGLGAKESELDQKIAAMAAKAAAAAASASALIAGVNSRVTAANQYASGATSTSAGSTTSAGAGMSSTKNTTVNVSYSGAYTKREAQRFGTALANQISSELAGKGG